MSDELTIHIYPSDCDSAGHVNHAQMLMLAATCLVFFPVLASGSFSGWNRRSFIGCRPMLMIDFSNVSR